MTDDLRISEITLINYRQYYGTVKINFPERNDAFSVVVGANGAGKSNLWNAIHWCLFGNEPHIKSDDTPCIINKKYLQQSIKKYCSMSIQIIMESGGTKYLIRRQIQGDLHFLKKDENGVWIMSTQDPVPLGFEIRDRDKSTLFQISENGGRWVSKSKEHDFKSLISQYIIPENLSHFFILDGEFLQELFGRFRNIQSGIDQISQINVLSEALSRAESARFPRLRKWNHEADEISAKIERHEQYLASEDSHGVVQKSRTKTIYGTDDYVHATGTLRERDLSLSISNMDDELKELQKKIDESNAAYKTELKERYKENQEHRDELRDQLERAEKECRISMVSNGPFILCRPQVDVAAKIIRAEIDKGKLPNSHRRAFVGDLLAKDSCVCGTSLVSGTDARKRVEHEMSSISGEVKFDIANEIMAYNDKFLEDYDDVTKQINAVMESILKLRIELGKLKEKTQDLRRQLPKDDEDHSELLTKRDDLQQDRDDCRDELLRETIAIEGRKKDKGSETRRLTTIKLKNRDERESALLWEKSGIVSSALRDIKNDVEAVTRRRVSEETLKIFNSLSWKKNYERLLIDDKYKIRLTGTDGFEILGGMAAGEKLFLALSFIMALKKITNYRFPFVIDSPLGKTGGNLRLSFGSHMPELLDGTQMIMLATNTEYGNQKIQSEDGGEAVHTLRDLFQMKVDVQEYKIDFNPDEETATIRRMAEGQVV